MLRLIPRMAAMSAIVFTFSFFKDYSFARSTELSGIIIDSKTHEPISSVHVYVVAGEEEALTGRDGQFKFTTWKSLPLSITVSHQDYQKKVVRVADASGSIRVQLAKN